jgi:phosphate/sulfate permease
MEEVKSNSGQNLGVAALITGIITFVLAVIPCVGVIAIIPGIITIVLASVGLSQVSRTDSPRGILVAGLIIGIVAVMISFSQIFIFARIASHKDKWPTDIRSAIEDARNNVEKEMEKSNVNIKIESDGKKIEINTNSGKDDREKQLEDLESGKKVQNDTLKKEIKPFKK